MKRLQEFFCLFLRVALAVGFLSAVASGLLLLAFAITMTLAFGIKQPLNQQARH